MPDPHAILARTRDVYASCRAYRDSGTVTTIMHADQSPQRQQWSIIHFSTLLRRPNAFRFQYAEQTVGPPETWPSHGAISFGGVAYEAFLERAGRIGSLSDALAGLTGVSGGAAHEIPSLLMHDGSGSHRVPLSPDRAEHVREARLDTHTCHVIRLSYERLPRDEDYWICQETGLILQIADEHDLHDPTAVAQQAEDARTDLARAKQTNNARDVRTFKRLLRHATRRRKEPLIVRTTTRYHPELDPDLPDHLFTTDPPSPPAIQQSRNLEI